MIPVSKPAFDDEMINYAAKAMKEEFFVNGDTVQEFEDNFASYIGTKHAIAVNSGTSALQLSLQALDISGSEVLTTPCSFVATGNVVLMNNAEPRFCDVRNDANIDPEKIRENISDDAEAIIPVHLYGKPCEMDEINEIADEFGLTVIEDASQSHGAEYKGQKTGSLGDIGCFSLYSTKNMTAGGNSGIVTTDDDDIAEKIRHYRRVGINDNGLHDVLGYSKRMNTVNAAFANKQLEKLEEWNTRRREIAKIYHKELPRDVLPPTESHVKHSHYVFPIFVDQRQKLSSFLEQNGVGTGIHYKRPIHQQPLYQKLGYTAKLPMAENLFSKTLSIPMHADMTNEQAHKVVTEVKRGLDRL